ncbi:hypothetical protein ACFVIM_13770 [Streptomyces sp. NPDC057638]|uniref:hypothetical protein n=1 Tax=Streptomyces sp. NPDC057638 TaxID=3346190 RepID=UPI00367EBB9A
MPDGLSYLPALAFLTLGYAALCAALPFGHCRRCRGWGAQVTVSRFNGRPKRGRTCRRCQGHGRRLRTGRRLYNLVARTRRDGTR